jgi:hypothetical protein
MPEKWLKIGFFAPMVVARSGGLVSFEEVLKACSAKPDDESRSLDGKTDAIRLQFVRESSSFWSGELMRIRMDESFKKANIKGRVEAIEFDEDEGLGEETAFLYDPQLNVLVFHEHRGGVTLTHSAKYFKVMAQMKSVEFAPLLKSDVLDRIANMGVIRRFIVHMAKINNAASLRGRGESTKKVLELTRFFQAPTIQLDLSIGKEETTLDKVLAFVRELSGTQDTPFSEVKKIVVIGSDAADDSQEEIINVIEDRLVLLRPVELKDGRVTDPARHGAVYDAWQVERDRISEIYAKTRHQRRDS